MNRNLSYLLLQIRNLDDPMCQQEIEAFAECLACETSQITVASLVREPQRAREFSKFDMVLIGGSGDFSVVSGGDWLPEALDCMRELVAVGKPTFASCWGFQALAMSLGSTVVTDLSRAEIGTPQLTVTEAGQADPVFEILGKQFRACMGHQDIVETLPANLVRLVSSDTILNEAFRVQHQPIYATQFHPELTLRRLFERLDTYPEYVANIAGIPVDELEAICEPTPLANRLLPRMVDVVFG